MVKHTLEGTEFEELRNKEEYVPTNETYKLKTYEDFMKLSPEQFAMMMRDFQEWHKAYKFIEATIEIAKSVDPDAEAELPDHFEWIDDGKHDGEMKINFVDPETEQGVEMTFTNPKEQA